MISVTKIWSYFLFLFEERNSFSAVWGARSNSLEMRLGKVEKLAPRLTVSWTALSAFIFWG